MIKIFQAMNIDQATLCMQGLAILLTVFLAVITFWSFLWLTIFVAVDLIQAPFTGFSPFAALCKNWGLKPGNIYN